MVHRYSLRFDAGERQGESVPITSAGLTVGRRPEQSLQLLDSSVSGRHAEIVMDDTGILVRDLGSTNGTRVRGDRVIEAHLAHGDRIQFGNVGLTFVDGAAAEHPTSEAAKAALVSEPAVERISPKALARAGKRPKLALIALILIGAAGAGAVLYLRREGPIAARIVNKVEAPAGNVLDDYSFESDADAWASTGESSAFQKVGDARHSGAMGMGADLDVGATVIAQSAEVRSEAGQEFTAEAMVRCSGGARASIGLEFSAPTDETGAGSGSLPAGPGPLTLWSAAIEAGASFERLEVTSTAPPGYSTVRVVAAGTSAREAGRVDLDDVALFERAGTPLPAIQFGERRLVSSRSSATASMASPAIAATLLEGDRVQLAAIQFHRASALPGDPSLAFAVREDPPASGRIVLSLGEASAAASQSGSGSAQSQSDAALAPTLRMRCEPALRRSAAKSDAGFEGGIATIGEDGYKTHGLEFERKRATDLLLGSGRQLVRVAVASPATFRGHAEDGASRISVHFDGAEASAVMQLDFQRERAEAGNAAHAARGAEKRGEIGESLRQWSLLLTSYPFEETLVREAESARARLTEKGLEELRAVRVDVENARFFRLTALFRQAREKAERVAELYTPSEVATEAGALLAEIDTELAGLESDAKATERARLESIVRALKANQSEGLAGVVEEYVRTHLAKGE